VSYKKYEFKKETMRTINTWINFNGNAEEAFTFYKSVFGGEFSKVVRFKDLQSEEFQIPENEADKIMTIALPLGQHNTLMANDVPEVMGRVNENENRSKIVVNAGSREEAEKTGYLPVEMSKGHLATVPGVHTPECSETNMVLNGSLNLTQLCS
jgi:uncharacterized glyoxalase superfamily protein PhnB